MNANKINYDNIVHCIFLDEEKPEERQRQADILCAYFDCPLWQGAITGVDAWRRWFVVDNKGIAYLYNHDLFMSEKRKWTPASEFIKGIVIDDAKIKKMQNEYFEAMNKLFE